jgi:hypothetical protein
VNSSTSAPDPRPRLDVRLAASALGVSATAMAALTAGREEIAYPVLGGALLLLAATGLAAANRRSNTDLQPSPPAQTAALQGAPRRLAITRK